MTSLGPHTTTDDLLADVSLRDLRILVTGVSSGLGAETARSLAARGAHVIGSVRDVPQARTATVAIQAAATAGGGTFELVELDLASLDSTRGLADRLLARKHRLDLVIANAGVMACPFSRTADGFERQLGTNHLGHFVLANRLVRLMQQDARLVLLSSAAHRFSDVDLEDPNFERTAYDPWIAYGRSKTANILFAVEFDCRHLGRGLRATAVHPGTIDTGLGRHLTPDLLQALAGRAGWQRPSERAAQPFKSVAQGAATTVWAGIVAEPERIGGTYCEDCRVAGIARDGESGGAQPYALDPERAKALWDRSEMWVNERY